MIHRWFFGAIGVLLFTTGRAEIPLYPTGPAEDAAFVRFVRALEGAMEICTRSSTCMVLEGEKHSTAWQAVNKHTPLPATLTHHNKKKSVKVTAKPGEFITIVGAPTAGSDWKTVIVREKPTDFSARKVSLGLMNVSENCALADLVLSGQGLPIVQGVSPGTIKRRQINPVGLEVSLYCQGKQVGSPLRLDTLKAGERWTLVVRSSKKAGFDMISVLDRMP